MHKTPLYDRYGNRNFDVANTTTLGSCSQQQCNPTVDATNNRFTSGQGYTYDLSGNVVTDAEGRTFTFDAENKQTLVKDSNNATIGQYYYDGDGKRVKKAATTENIVFIYDASGRLVEEYSGSTLQTSYVYAGSRLLTTETATGTNYLTSDHLGSPRINTDASGNVIARHDYMPFGEEIFSFGGRTSGLRYDSDSVRKKFTGYERDSESGLDFAQARYFISGHGRFSSPDPENAGAVFDLPQSWNAYSYVLNNPLIMTDPSGLIWLRQLGSDTWTWVDNDVYEANLKKDKNYYNGFVKYEGQAIKAIGGTLVSDDPSLKGQKIILDPNAPRAYAVSEADLERGTVHIGQEQTPLQQLLNGAENRTLWLWRPTIYASSPAVMLPALTPLMAFGGGSAVGGGILELNVGSGMNGFTTSFLTRTFISAGQNRLLSQLFNTGRIPPGLTKRAVEAYLEAAKRYLTRSGMDPRNLATQMERIRILEEAIKKMVYP